MKTKFNVAPKHEARGMSYKVPAGIYVAKIIAVKEEEDTYGPALKLALDIAEGEYAGYYQKRYTSDQEYAKNNPDKAREAKWKGTIRFRIPQGQDPEHDGRNEAILQDALARIIDSNSGLSISWEKLETQLIGKFVGINVRESTYNGNVFTEIGRLETVEDVREGRVRPMPPRGSRQAAAEPEIPAGYTPVNTGAEALPF